MGSRRLSVLLALCVLMVLAAPVAVSADVGDVTRVAGDTRIDTAVDVARDTYDRADTAVLATARNYPDALSGSVLAETLDAPLLLVEPDQLPAVVLDTVADLGVTEVVLLGGEVAISAGVEADLEDRFGDD